MDARTETTKLLDTDKAVKLRDSKHEVWRLSNGNLFTRSKSPSDHRTEMNQLSCLRRELGIRNTKHTDEAGIITPAKKHKNCNKSEQAKRRRMDGFRRPVMPAQVAVNTAGESRDLRSELARWRRTVQGTVNEPFTMKL